MPELRYVKHKRVPLKGHGSYTEKWVEQRIAEDPSILGLGELEVIDRERRQEKAGRLDLLLADPEEDRRYELELMLGSTDESHIIRCIEYWDNERRHYPAYDHVAVLVAEDVTTRFLSLLALFAGSIPLIVLQLNAIEVENCLTLGFTRILDQATMRRD